MNLVSEANPKSYINLYFVIEVGFVFVVHINRKCSFGLDSESRSDSKRNCDFVAVSMWFYGFIFVTCLDNSEGNITNM